jgi:hypothetical protein
MRYKRLTVQDPLEKAKRGSLRLLRQWSAVLMTSTERTVSRLSRAQAALPTPTKMPMGFSIIRRGLPAGRQTIGARIREWIWEAQ